MPLRLVQVVEDLDDALKSPRILEAVAEALEETFTKGVASTPIGGDLRLRNFRGAPMSFEASYTQGTGIVTLPLKGGTYALADKGRYKAPKRGRIRSHERKRRGKPRPTVSTPWGPRVSVRRSKWPGFHLTDRFSTPTLDKATEAAIREGLKIFARTA